MRAFYFFFFFWGAILLFISGWLYVSSNGPEVVDTVTSVTDIKLPWSNFRWMWRQQEQVSWATQELRRGKCVKVQSATVFLAHKIKLNKWTNFKGKACPISLVKTDARIDVAKQVGYASLFLFSTGIMLLLLHEILLLWRRSKMIAAFAAIVLLCCFFSLLDIELSLWFLGNAAEIVQKRLREFGNYFCYFLFNSRNRKPYSDIFCFMLG